MKLVDINAYWLVIGASLIIIVSYFFNLISKKWSIPSVLLLIALGIALRYTTGIDSISGDSPILGVLGVVGLIMIVLEASLDLELKREKLGLIRRSFSVALLTLTLSVYLVALVLQFFLGTDMFTALLYAIPLSIMSSAIIIPSVTELPEHKKEFMIYESTFSDILGIMFFYFLLGSVEFNTTKELVWNISANILLTIAISIVLSFGIIYLFQKIRTEVKLFLLISVLVLLYAVGKMMHLSALIIILFFGLILNNRHLFLRGRFAKYVNKDELSSVFKNFQLITVESAFVVRTFFFVIFGLTISLSSLFQLDVLLISIILLAVLYGIRFLMLKIFLRSSILPELFIAPRGLITVLLFFAIPEEYQVVNFESGVLLFLIIASSIIMAIALIRNNRKPKSRKASTNNYTSQDIETAFEKKDSYGKDDKYSDE
jgi:NhaP-type Na+/H+ or K+/H+ antiporter